MNVVADLLAERTGLWFGAHNIDLLERGLGQLGAALGLPIDVLCERLRTDDPKSALWHKLVEVVTVGETYLFRHPEQLTLLGQRLVPERLAKGQRLLRAWSAGCATGEEAYSLAMVLHRAAPSCELSVLGTDISTQALAVAARGKYGPNSQREPIPAAMRSLLLSHSEGSVEVIPQIRALVELRAVNLVDEEQLATVPGGFDFIFCRNVLIYFTKDQGQRVLKALRDRLAPGGVLVLTALDQREQIEGLTQQVLDGVPILRRMDAVKRTPTPRALPMLPPVPPKPARLLSAHAEDIRQRAAEVKAAADQGDLHRASHLARRLLMAERTPETLHLLALILSEQGRHSEAEQLLSEALQVNPQYVQGHLSLGLLERPQHQKWRGAEHLHTVISLLAQCRDDELLQGPEPLQAAHARRLASAGLANLERRS